MNTPKHAPRDAFEARLRQLLGPDSVQVAPPALRASLLARVAELPPAAERFQLEAALLRSLLLGLAGLAAGWLVVGPLRGLGRLLADLPTLSRATAQWHDVGLLLGLGDWLDLLRSPVALALLPLFLLPLLYFMQDEGSRE